MAGVYADQVMFLVEKAKEYEYKSKKNVYNNNAVFRHVVLSDRMRQAGSACDGCCQNRRTECGDGG